MSTNIATDPSAHTRHAQSDPAKAEQPLFLRAALGGFTERPPVWFMRQAGRYMPEYRAIKEKHDFLEMCKTPKLAADVTMLPVDILGIDAAILFCDILVTAEAMGGQLSFEKGAGPRFANPVRHLKDIEALQEPKTEEAFAFVGEAIKEVRRRLKARAEQTSAPSTSTSRHTEKTSARLDPSGSSEIPLIGFAGAPFTVMSYLVEGQGTKDFKQSKLMLHQNPDWAHQLLGKLSRVTLDYLRFQIRSGAQSVQLFDSWAMALSQHDFLEFAHRYNEQIIKQLRKEFPLVPLIYFARGSSIWAPIMAKAQPHVVSLDWNANLLEMRRACGPNVALQGNLDPNVLYASKEVIKKEVLRICELMQHEPGFIFNLGHGLSPDMDPEKVKWAVQTVQEFRNVG